MAHSFSWFVCRWRFSFFRVRCHQVFDFRMPSTNFESIMLSICLLVKSSIFGNKADISLSPLRKLKRGAQINHKGRLTHSIRESRSNFQSFFSVYLFEQHLKWLGHWFQITFIQQRAQRKIWRNCLHTNFFSFFFHSRCKAKLWSGFISSINR